MIEIDFKERKKFIENNLYKYETIKQKIVEKDIPMSEGMEDYESNQVMVDRESQTILLRQIFGKIIDDLNEGIININQANKDLVYIETEMKSLIEKDEKEKNVKKKVLTDERIESIKQKAYIQLLRYKLKSDFVELFGEYSFRNELYAEASFHSVFGAICFKDKNSTEDQILSSHLFVIQNSGSGKDKGANFIIKLVEDINTCIMNYNVTTGGSMSKINCIRIGGQETPEVMIDYFPDHPIKQNKLHLWYYEQDYIRHKHEWERLTKKGIQDGDEVPPTKGVLSQSDILISEECSHLFNQYMKGSKEKVELLLQSLEGKGFRKTLKSWQGRHTETFFKGSFIGLSRPVDNMKEHIANSGFQQRGLNVMRDIDTKERIEMTKLVITKELRTEEENKELDERRMELAKEFFKLRNWVNDNKITYDSEEAEDISLLQNKLFSGYFIDCIESNIKQEQRNIMETFMGRYPDHIKKLSIHYAAIRRSNKIEIADIQNSFITLNKLHDGLGEWVEEKIVESKELRWKRKNNTSLITKLMENYNKENKDNIVPMKYLIDNIAQQRNCSISHARNMLKKFVGKLNLLEEIKKEGIKGNNKFYILRNPMELYSNKQEKPEIKDI